LTDKAALGHVMIAPPLRDSLGLACCQHIRVQAHSVFGACTARTVVLHPVLCAGSRTLHGHKPGTLVESLTQLTDSQLQLLFCRWLETQLGGPQEHASHGTHAGCGGLHYVLLQVHFALCVAEFVVCWISRENRSEAGATVNV
jgi:hypothetical protein